MKHRGPQWCGLLQNINHVWRSKEKSLLVTVNVVTLSCAHLNAGIFLLWRFHFTLPPTQSLLSIYHIVSTFILIMRILQSTCFRGHVFPIMTFPSQTGNMNVCKHLLFGKNTVITYRNKPSF